MREEVEPAEIKAVVEISWWFFPVLYWSISMLCWGARRTKMLAQMNEKCNLIVGMTHPDREKQTPELAPE